MKKSKKFLDRERIKELETLLKSSDRYKDEYWGRLEKINTVLKEDNSSMYTVSYKSDPVSQILEMRSELSSLRNQLRCVVDENVRLFCLVRFQSGDKTAFNPSINIRN